jgi:hypothetical protein
MRTYPPHIESDTPIVPRAVAEAVWEEAAVWLDEPLPRRWRSELIARANTVYARNARFRRTLRRDGDAGRDWLWAFMRHWLTALIRRHRPHLHARLPQSYNNGDALPPQRIRPPRRLEADRGVPLPARPRSRPTWDQAWAAAAHFHWG